MKDKRDKIEELILGNLDKFEEKEPLEGHFDRFEAKLAKQAKRKIISLRNVWRVAATVVFVFLAVNQALIYFSPKNAEINSLSSVSAEYSEVEYYYTSAIQRGLNQWEDFYNAGILSEKDNLMMKNELDEFDSTIAKLQDELKTNPNDERVINAMLKYYQTKLNLINLIINNLQEVKTQNITNHEIEI